jgi:hypothetical protein
VTARALAAVRSAADDRGMVLPLAMVILLILAALATALLGIGSAEVFIAANQLRGTQALFAAEAGLEHAIDVFRGNTALLSPTPAVTTLTVVPGLSATGNSLGTIGSYLVQYRTVGTDTIEVVATGTTAVGSGTRVLRATLTAGSFTSNDAILTKDDLKISGNPTITGACGSTHTNSDFTVSGNPSSSGNMTATGTYTESGHPTNGAGSGGGKAAKTIPVVDPAQALIKAKASVAADKLFQMKADGQILDGNNQVLTTLTSGQEFNGWKYNAGSTAEWSLSGNNAVDGTYYLEGNAKVSGNPGSATTPWNVSLIATGDIEISGNPEITTHFANNLLIAGADIKMSGNPTQGFNGLIAAHEQIAISGNPSITGSIIAEDAASASGTVTENKVSGNATISYSCGLATPFGGGLQILTWGS